MNAVRNTVRKGFTLVEILIVVVILGILAAIVIPQFSSASQAAKASSMSTQLQSIRSQLELYQLQHLGAYPTAGADGTGAGEFWEQLNGFTDEAGAVLSLVDDAAVADARAAGTDVFGPYMQKAVSNPFTVGAGDADKTIEASADLPLGDAGTTGNGWLYNDVSGEIKAILDEDIASEVNFKTADGDVATY